MKSVPWTERTTTMNSSSSSSYLNKSKPSYYLDQSNFDDTIYHKGASTSRSINSKYYQLRQNQKNNDRTMDKIRINYSIQDIQEDTVQQLKNQVQKLIDELKVQIDINKEILSENEKLTIKYRRLKQKIMNYIQNDGIDTERIFTNYNATLEKLVTQQNNLKEVLQNSEQKEMIDVNSLNEDRILEQKYLQIKQENTELNNKIYECNFKNLEWSPKIIKEERKKTPTLRTQRGNEKQLNGNDLLAELMKKENLENIQQEISGYRYNKFNVSRNNQSFLKDSNEQQHKEMSNDARNQSQHKLNPKSTPLKSKCLNGYINNNEQNFMQKNLYSFGHKSPLANSKNSEDKVDDIVNFNSKLSYNSTGIPFTHSMKNVYGHSKNSYKSFPKDILANIEAQYKL